MEVSVKRKLEFIERRITQGNLADVLAVHDRSIRRWKQGTRTPDAVTVEKITKIYEDLHAVRAVKSPDKKRKTLDKLTRTKTGSEVWFGKRKVLDKLRVLPVGLPAIEFLANQVEYEESNKFILRLFLREKFELMHTVLVLLKPGEEDEEEDEDEDEGKTKKKEGLRLMIGQRLHLTVEGLEEGLTWALILEALHSVKYGVILLAIEYHGKTERYKQKPKGVEDVKPIAPRKNK